MKPAYQIDLRDPERALVQQNDLINRDAARSRSVATTIPTPQTLTLVDVSYLPITHPMDVGTTLRGARLLPAADYRIGKYGAALVIGVGLRANGKFELLGREWSSVSHAMTGGEPFDLVTEETPLREGVGLAVRVSRRGWPDSWPMNLCVESTLGYDPGA